jgi:preprotein translocase subunit SecA
MGIFSKLFGTKNDREIKKLQPRVVAIQALEPQVQKLSDEQLTQKILTKREAVMKTMADRKAKKPRGEDLTKDEVNDILDEHLHETFAIVREAGHRVLGMRHYDVQMIGGMTLHMGRISEMKTGEGKTLVATLPAVLNTLTGGSVHVVTVNDYLATRDAEWMGRIYRFLGLQVGVVVPQQGDKAKREAYQADITYGQNNEFGFDYLRDNMKFDLRDYMQRGHAFSIVDEVDSILIDEARTPLIISGPSEEDVETYRKANAIVPQLRKDEHYTIDEKARSVIFTEAGVTRAEHLVGVENLYDPINIEKLHRITSALRAHTLYKRDVDYVVEKSKVVIVDEHTGRLMYGRRWSDGLHGAVEAKESLNVEPETRTLATISFQNYFRMYRKLSGMTGTADTEAEEFAKIYNLDVTLIPTNRTIQRKDEQDLIYKTEREKFEAIAEDIRSAHQKGQPVLVGTVSVEKSEVLSNLLKKTKWTDKDGVEHAGVAHQVLNAKRHKDEAAIVAQAGKLGAVTIATNMAGRGTDILLGGNPEYMARQEVARLLGGTEEQVAEYGFLLGRPDLINIKKLAERDAKDAKYLALWEAKKMEHELDTETAQLEGKDVPEWPADLPPTLEAARAQVLEQRTAFYEKAIALYSDALPRCEEECGKAKVAVKEAGGLRIVGTERHESRRIDNQLRGRAGRQGDPGSSRFYMSMQDDLMRIFGSEKMIRIMEALGMKDGEPIEHGMVTRSIADAQKRVEGMHFDSRKNLIEYDDVMNQQRKAVYSLRRRVLDGHELKEMVLDLVEALVVQQVTENCPEKAPPSEWKIPEVAKAMDDLMGVNVDLTGAHDRDAIMDRCFAECARFYDAKEKAVGPELMRRIESFMYLNVIDEAWKQHLSTMEHLREGIHLRSYGQKDPKQEYKKEGYNIFAGMMARVRDESLDKVFKAIPREGGEAELERLRAERAKRRQKQANVQAQHPSTVDGAPTVRAPAGTIRPPQAGRPPQGGGMPIPQAGAPSIAGAVGGGVRTSTSSSMQNGGASLPPRPLPSGGARPNLKAEIEAAEDEANSNLNRAQRRKLEAQQRKGSGKRPGAR